MIWWGHVSNVPPPFSYGDVPRIPYPFERSRVARSGRYRRRRRDFDNLSETLVVFKTHRSMTWKTTNQHLKKYCLWAVSLLVFSFTSFGILPPTADAYFRVPDTDPVTSTHDVLFNWDGDATCDATACRVVVMGDNGESNGALGDCFLPLGQTSSTVTLPNSAGYSGVYGPVWLGKYGDDSCSGALNTFGSSQLDAGTFEVDVCEVDCGGGGGGSTTTTTSTFEFPGDVLDAARVAIIGISLCVFLLFGYSGYKLSV